MVKLYNDNCLNIINTLNEKCLLISDPPFNINYHYNEYNDNLSENEYYNLLKLVFFNFKHIIIHYPENLYKYSLYINKSPNRIVSWVYNSNTPRQHRDIAFFDIKPDFSKGKQQYKNLKDKRIIKRILEGKSAKLYDWWEINQVKNISKEKTLHPCQMPLDVMINIISILPNEYNDYTIVDPFMGSGTTGVACIKLNKNFIGIEKDKIYYDIAVKRITETNNNINNNLLEIIKY